MSHPLPIPKPGILDISPYTPGKSRADGAARVLKLSSNENPFGPGPKALAAYAAHASKLHRYPDGGTTKLCDALARMHGLDARQIVCGTGSDELIGLLVHAYAGVSDEVLISEHGFLMYKIYTQGNGATLVTAPEKNLTADVNTLLAAVTAKTRILFLANPNNPTGSYLSVTEIRRLRNELRSDIILVVDAAYAEYVDRPDYTAGQELAVETPNTVMLRTFSKIYGLPSLRLGWGCFPPAIAEVIHRVRGPFNVSGAAQETGLAALEDTHYTEQMKRHNSTQLKWLAEQLSALSLTVYPSVANFLLVGFPQEGKTSSEANKFLLSRGIIVREVASYGLPHCLRITIGTEEENRAVAETLREFMA